ncbi:hypothetical protein WME73_48270 [Sorangium sp. So ce302]|uniref:hypothetical protein n=1 Tax=unclassified Sorangium TaxID=2621164 RepID=UPI003F5F0E70
MLVRRTFDGPRRGRLLRLLAFLSALLPPLGARAAEATAASPPPEVAPRDADSAGPGPAEARLVLGSRLVGRDTGGGLELDGRVRLAGGAQLGAAASFWALERAYMGGRTVPGASGASGAAVFLMPLVTHGPLELDLRLRTGFLALRDVGGGNGGGSSGGGGDAPASALRHINELSMVAHVALGEAWLLRAGAAVGFELELDPTTELADLAQVLTAGAGYAVSEHVLLTLDASAGGSFGFNGDNGKFLLEGAFGARFAFGQGGSRVAH